LNLKIKPSAYTCSCCLYTHTIQRLHRCALYHAPCSPAVGNLKFVFFKRVNVGEGKSEEAHTVDVVRMLFEDRLVQARGLVVVMLGFIKQGQVIECCDMVCFKLGFGGAS